jgi:hypothetical protein
MSLYFWLAAMKGERKKKDENGCGHLPHLPFQQ